VSTPHSRNVYPVEFVSDPIRFANGAHAICKPSSQLKKYFELSQQGQLHTILGGLYSNAGIKFNLRDGGDRSLSQALQVTYSFPMEKGMLSLRAINKFLSEQPYVPNQPVWSKFQDMFFVKHLVHFLDNDNSVKNTPDFVKFFYFFILQYFTGGAQANQCILNDYAKLVSGVIILRTDMAQYVSQRNANGRTVKDDVGVGDAAVTRIITVFRAFRTYFNNAAAAANQVAAQNRLPQIVQIADCSTTSLGRTTYYFAKKYEMNRKFPFTANEYIKALFPQRGASVDLFKRNAAVFDNAFGRFPLMVANAATVIYELRYLDGFNYMNPPTQTSAKQFVTKLPTFFNIGREIMTKAQIAQMDLTVKKCSDDGLSVVAGDQQRQQRPRPLGRSNSVGSNREKAQVHENERRQKSH